MCLCNSRVRAAMAAANASDVLEKVFQTGNVTLLMDALHDYHPIVRYGAASLLNNPLFSAGLWFAVAGFIGRMLYLFWRRFVVNKESVHVLGDAGVEAMERLLQRFSDDDGAVAQEMRKLIAAHYARVYAELEHYGFYCDFEYRVDSEAHEYEYLSENVISTIPAAAAT